MQQHNLSVIPPASKLGGQLLPLIPQSYQEVQAYSRDALTAGLLQPQIKRENRGGTWTQVKESEEATLARGCLIIMQGLEVGLPPMAALQTMALINGRITIHSDGVPALLWKNGFKIGSEFVGTQYEDDFKAVVTITRPDGNRITREFSVADAKEAGLWQTQAYIEGYNGKSKPNDSPWWRYRKRMLYARALGFSWRDGAADVARGIYVREEMEDVLRVQAASDRAMDVTPNAAGRTRSIASEPPISAIPDLPDIFGQKVPVDASPAAASTPDEPQATAAAASAPAAQSEPDADTSQAVADADPVAKANADILARIKARLKASPRDALDIRDEFFDEIKQLSETDRTTVLDTIDRLHAKYGGDAEEAIE